MSTDKKGACGHKSARRICSKKGAKQETQQQGKAKGSTIKYVRGPANNLFVYG